MPIRIDDVERVAAVHRTGLLDRDGNEDLDRLSRLTLELLGVPMSLVSLVDDDRQYFAGQAGLDEPWLTAKETPLSHSFCQFVVASDTALVVDDSSGHPLVGDSLAVTDLGVAAYIGVPVHDAHGQVLGALCALDRTPRTWTERELAILDDLGALVSNAVELNGLRDGLPTRDLLTGLPNRELLRELTDRAIRDAARSSGMTAVVAIGLAGFRLVNEALGHAAGDELLVLVAERLTKSLRHGDAVCRLAGDEFLVVCERVQDEADALRIAERLRHVVTTEAYELAGTEQPIMATIGLATTAEVIDAEELMAGALAAMQRAKSGSSDKVERVESRSQRGAATQLQVRNAVAQAHERDEMSLVYQPLVDLETDRIVGLEALLRWDHPQLGRIAPADFIPAAEQSGAIIELGRWVIEQACCDLASWRQLPAASDLHMAVNVAPAQIAVPIFAQKVAAALSHCGVPAHALTLEITERTLLADRAAHRLTLSKLRELGVRIALDDFGTGFSSLGYLSRFDLDDLKIDKLFIDELPDDEQGTAIVKGILALSHALGLRTVAEGIEHSEQLSALKELGCDLGQGYHLSRPVSPGDITRLLS